MIKGKRRNHSPSSEAKVAMAALRGDKTLAGIAQKCDVHPNQIQGWKNRLMSEAGHVFDNGNVHAGNSSDQKVARFGANVGEFTMEKDFLSKALGRDR